MRWSVLEQNGFPNFTGFRLCPLRHFAAVKPTATESFGGPARRPEARIGRNLASLFICVTTFNIRSQFSGGLKPSCAQNTQLLPQKFLAFALPDRRRTTTVFSSANFSVFRGAKVPEGHKVKAGHLRTRARHREECRE
jgi:hypothetical protein